VPALSKQMQGECAARGRVDGFRQAMGSWIERSRYRGVMSEVAIMRLVPERIVGVADPSDRRSPDGRDEPLCADA